MKKLILLLLLLSVHGIYAQVEFKAVPGATTLGINEKLTVDFVMNADGDNFNPPSFKGFSVSGPTQTIGHPYVNKKQTYSKTYTYTLSPRSRGTFSIGQASIEVDGKVYKTIPFKVVVTGAVQNGVPQGQPTTKIGEGIYVVAEVSNKNPYVNEPVSVQYRLYVDEDVSISNYDQLDTPKFNDAWSQVIPFKETIENGMYKGKPHRFITFEKIVVYPQKSGRLDVEPLSMNVFIEVPTGRVDALGQELQRIVPRVFASEKLSLEVKPLPEQGKPINFRGAVGDFTFKITPSKTTAASGESLQLDVTVAGRGNFKLFDLPKPMVPAALELYDPERRDNVATKISGLQGAMTDVYTIIPQYKGKFTIRPVVFSFFDPKLKIYRTITSAAAVIDVPTGPDATAAAYEDAVGTTKQSVQASEQLRFIALKTSLETAGKQEFFGSAFFYILLLLPLLLIPALAVLLKRRTAGENDIKGNKAKETNRMAKLYLAEAKTHLGHKEQFYEALERALHNFLKAKLAIETSQMTKHNIKELLLSKKANPVTVEDFIRVVDNCEFARYAPSSGTAMQQDYDSAEAVITALEKQI